MVPPPSRRAGSGAEALEFFRPAPPRVLAHRGLALEAPENTLLAFAKALALGVTHIETDVHASADGVAVIAHDESLDRVADRKVRVDQLTMAELRRVELGEGQGFCSLSEALDAFPEARFNIDIKSSAAIAPTVRAIQELRATERVLVTSFSDARRRKAVAALPGVATSVSAGSTLRLVLANRSRWSAAARRVLASVHAVQVPERWKAIRVVTPSLIRACHEADVEVHVWTVNDSADMTRLLDLGIDGLVTDRADLAVEVIRRRS
ncbi:MAG: glycerophosphodiester phosphodiesterase [Cryobacterium sp.]|nr:glycerophosphodiester phosphodiesterase [Cryobacterium sp.]